MLEPLPACPVQRIQEQEELIAAAEANGYQDAVEILDKFQEDKDKAGEQARWGGAERVRTCQMLVVGG